MYPPALAGVRKPPGKEPAVGGVGVAVYGDLTAERRGRLTLVGGETATIRLQQTGETAAVFDRTISAWRAA